VEPVEPVKPVVGLAVVEPATPLPVVEPVDPVAPLEPPEPVEPIEPLEPVAPEVPAEPGVDVPLVLAPDVGKLLPPVVDGFCVVLPAVVELDEPPVEPVVEPVLLPGIFLLVSTMMLSFIKFDDQTSAMRTGV
jgi:hypothetical protein